MSTQQPEPTTHTLRASDHVLRAVGGGLAALSMVLVNLGCGCDGNLPACGPTRGLTDRAVSPLVEGEVEGVPAEAEAQIDARGTTVTLSPSAPGGHRAVIAIPGRTLEMLPLGDDAVGAAVAVTICDGGAVSACLPVEHVVLDVEDLGDGTVRGTYTGTMIDAEGRELPAEGAFVFARAGI